MSKRPLSIIANKPTIGSSPMVSFKDVCGGKDSVRPFFCTYGWGENGNGNFDDFNQPEKRRCLTFEQFYILEEFFEVEQKLEPEMNFELAKDLELEPLQVANWFHNRRTRWKTEQFKKDYKRLQSDYNIQKAKNELLLREVARLKTQTVYMRARVFLAEKAQRELFEPFGMKCDEPQRVQEENIIESAFKGKDPKVSVFTSEQEDMNSSNRKVINPNNPHHVDPSHSTFGEPADFSPASEAEHSDTSQYDEEFENFLNNVILEDGNIKYQDSPAKACNYGLSAEDHVSLAE